jgi:hypothetical protein
MAASSGHGLDFLSRGSAEKWLVIGSVVHTKDWVPPIKLCLILLVLQVPLDIGALLWVVLR